MSIFDIVNNLSSSKTDISDSDDFKKNYSQFMVNRIFSLGKDTVFFANEMNRIKGLNDKDHYAFYFHGLSKRKRYFKYPKNIKSDKDLVDSIQWYYNVNENKAYDIIELLDEEVLNKIKESYLNVKF